MRFVIFSGTTEGRKLSALLAEAGAKVTVCVASDYGSEEQGRIPGVETRTGPQSPEEKTELLEDCALCIDATHPYATHVTASVREACRKAGVPYLRLLRPASETEGARCFETAKDAALWLGRQEGNILLTTGAKELSAYADIDPERLYPRILPSHASLGACEQLGIPHRNIIAMQGPFSSELNRAIIHQYRIRYLVSKDGGVPGGFPEKAEAARETGTELIVLCRPEENGLDFETVYHRCITLLSGSDAIK